MPNIPIFPARPDSAIPLGRQGEHLARCISFDVSAWEAQYGPGSPLLLHQRPSDSAPYPVAVQYNGGRVLWTVTFTDTEQVCQYGKAELRWIAGETLVKSAVYQTSVEASISALTPQEAQEAGMDWIDSLLDAVQDATNAANHAAQIQSQPVTSENNGLMLAADKIKLDGMDANKLASMDAEKLATLDADKLAGIAPGAQVNVLESVTVNGNAVPVSGKAANIAVPTKTSDLTNDGDGASPFQTSAQVQSAINVTVSSAYKIGGSVASVSALPTLTAANAGFVYNLSAAFTTTANFIEGAGKSYPAGTNVVVAQTGNVYKYDVLAGFVDLSPYAQTANVNSALNGKVDKTTTVNGKALSSDITLGKSDVDLANVDNTADLDKPISTATRTALNGKAAQSDLAAAQETIIAQGQTITAQEAKIALLQELVNGIDAPVFRMKSGAFVSISDGAAANVKALSVDIQPVQSFNGYDRPWIGGQGKNLCPGWTLNQTQYGMTVVANGAEIRLNGKVNNSDGLYLNCPTRIRTLKAGTTYIINMYVVGNNVNIDPIKFYTWPRDANGDVVTSDDNPSQYNANGAALTLGSGFSAENYLVGLFIPNGYSADNLTLRVMLREAGTSADWEPYENLCSISGWDSVSITRKSKNLLPVREEAGDPNTVVQTTFNAGFWAWNYRDGSYLFKGTAAGDRYYPLADIYLPPGNYILSGAESAHVPDFLFYCHVFNGETYITGGDHIIRTNSDGTRTLTLAPGDYTFVRIGLVTRNGTTIPNNTVVWPMVRSASVSDSTWTPYSVQSAISLVDSANNDAQLTVYGGKLELDYSANPATCKLTVTHRFIQFNGTETLVMYDANPDKVFYFATDSKPTDGNIIGNIICSHCESASAGTAWYDSSRNFVYLNDNGKAFLKIHGIESVSAMQSWLAEQASAGTPVQVVYELAAPVEYTLSAPPSLSTLHGINTISADGGNLSVTYQADTALSLAGE